MTPAWQGWEASPSRALRPRLGAGPALAMAAVLALLAALAPFPAPRPACAGVPAKSCLLYNATTGTMLYQKSADMKIPPASLTKIMTSFLVHDAMRRGRLSPGSRVRITQASAGVGGSSMRLRSGERLPVWNLLEGMIIASGNDAATALAYRAGGSLNAFVGAMNAKASALGMRSTRFRNPTGLPAAGQITTARDMLRLSLSYMRSYPSALRIHSQSLFRHGRRTLTTTNPFLGERGVDGLKTGFTAGSGYNIIVTARRGGVRLVAVVLGGRTSAKRNRAARELLDAGFKFPKSPARVRAQLDGRGPRTLATRHARPARRAAYRKVRRQSGHRGS